MYSVSHRTCKEKLEPWGFITAVARPHMASSKKTHVRGHLIWPTLQYYVTSITITLGTMQKLPRICEVISGLYCTNSTNFSLS